jgi:hypothetical protein
MRGETVIVRAFGDRPLKRKVWEVGDAVVYVTNDEEFDKLSAGIAAQEPIGFPKEDVFRDTESESFNDSVDWSQLVPWQS